MNNPANTATISERISTVNLAQRFWTKVDKTATCWLWTAATSNGYGNFRVKDGQNVSAHRIAYVAEHGDVPQGLELDHLCRNRRCVNPAHLEPVTRRENVLRGRLPEAMLHVAGRCRNGHEVNERNTLHRMRNGRLQVSGCRPCRNARMRAKRAARVDFSPACVPPVVDPQREFDW